MDWQKEDRLMIYEDMPLILRKKLAILLSMS